MFQPELISKCRKNDRKAQLQLYKQYCDAMFIISNRYLHRVEDAEDAMQEGFIKAFQRIAHYKGEVTFGAWLKRIIINTCLDKIRASKQSFVGLDEQHLNIVEDTNDWYVEDHISKEDIKSAIYQLQDKYKYVLLLYLIEGYDHEEISEILSISTTASRTQLFRGKKKLQNLLKTIYHGTGY